jgi:hypothetical protein
VPENEKMSNTVFMLVFVMCVKLIFLGSKIISSFYQMHFFSLSGGTFFIQLIITFRFREKARKQEHLAPEERK